jgi:hypothetical protein
MMVLRNSPNGPKMGHLLGFQLLLLLLDSVEALPSFLNPVSGPTLQDEIMCYGIPYGGIGFASHVITYYTLGALWFGVKPFAPWSPLNHHLWDGLVAVLTFGGGNALAIFTVIRCRNRWQFVVIAVWKITLSTTLALTALTNAIYIPINDGHDPDDGPLPSLLWGILYVLGLIVGMVGVFSLVKETWLDIHEVRIVTYVFGGISGGIIAIVLLSGIAMFLVGLCLSVSDDDSDEGEEVIKTGCGTAGTVVLAGGPIALVIFGVFYSDWILAAIAGNLAGAPSGDVAILYWLYFAFKRFPLFSF